MVILVIEFITKPRRAQQLCERLQAHAQFQISDGQGLIMHYSAVCTAEPRKVLAMSMWRTRRHAERHLQEQFPEFCRTVWDILDNTPRPTVFALRSKVANGRTAMGAIPAEVLSDLLPRRDAA